MSCARLPAAQAHEDWAELQLATLQRLQGSLQEAQLDASRAPWTAVVLQRSQLNCKGLSMS